MYIRTRKGPLIIIVLLAIACTAAALIPKNITEDDIIAFLGKNGHLTSGKAIAVKEITVPKEFGTVYEKYNALQKAQGFDLSEYRTDTVKQYTYIIINYPGENGKPLSDIYANVLVFGGKIIGGEIFSTALDGFMCGFKGEKV